MDDAVLRVQDLTVRFGGLVAVDHCTFHVEQGEVVGLIGPNGAGKSTLINAVSGLAATTEGTVHLMGMDISDDPPHKRFRSGMGRGFQRVALAHGLTVRQHLQAAVVNGRLFGRRALPDRHVQTVQACDVERILDERVDDLDFLNRRLVGIAMALVGGERLCLLDEATAGVTEAEREFVADIVVRAAEESGRAFLVVEHDLAFVRRIATRTIVMDHGAVIADGPTQRVLDDPQVVKAYVGEG